MPDGDSTGVAKSATVYHECPACGASAARRVFILMNARFAAGVRA